jgi:hypothetical protein
MSALEVPGVHVHVSHIQCLKLSHQVFLLLKRKEERITFSPEISALERLITKTYLIETASEIVSFSPFNHRIRENSDPGSGSYNEIPNPGKTRAGILVLRPDFSNFLNA